MKKFFRNNRVFIVLMAVVIICFILIGIYVIRLFYGNGESKYGDRLDNINNVLISDSKLTDLSNKLESDETITNASVYISGRIVYIRIIFNDKIALVEAENKALATLDDFSVEEKAYYDFHYTIKQSASSDNEGFVLMGAKNINSETISWNNNTPITSSEES